MSDVTQLLGAIDAGDPKAADQLLPLVYEELRKRGRNDPHLGCSHHSAGRRLSRDIFRGCRYAFNPPRKHADRATLGCCTGALLSTITLNTTNTTWRNSACTRGGGHLALSTGRLLEVFETQTGRCLKQSAVPAATETMDFSRDGEMIAFGSSDKGTLWDVATGQVVRALDGHKNRVNTIAFSVDQKTIATGSWDHTVRLWEVATGKELGVLTRHKATVKACVFSPDRRTLATASDDRTIKFWNLATLREVGSIQLDYVVWVLAFSPDGKTLVANNGRESLRLWRAPSQADIDAAAAQEQARNEPR